jgi:hypothetical protein
MSNEYKIDAAKISEIAKKFGLKEDQVEKIQKQYLEISPSIKEQYLAHMIRSLECYFRLYLRNENFLVVCEPFRNISQG